MSTGIIDIYANSPGAIPGPVEAEEVNPGTIMSRMILDKTKFAFGEV